MAVLVTRPLPNAATAEALQARSYTPLLSPLLVFQPLPFVDEGGSYGGVIVTSANALRAIAETPLLARITALPLFAVGDATAAAAKQAGFAKVTSSGGDAASLQARIAKSQKKATAPLLYLHAEEISRDLVTGLKADGIAVVAAAVYRMAMIGRLPDDVRDAFAANAIEAVLHYSRRSAQAYVAAVAHAGLSISALGVPQLCLSANIADVLRQADAPHVIVAAAPNEAALLDALATTVPR